MANLKLLIVFGGSFNPPTYAHLYIANKILEMFGNKLIFAPVNEEYEKSGLMPINNRIEMLKIITENNSNIIISDIDKNTNGSLRTIDLLNEIKNQYPDNEIAFIIGTDNLIDLPNWKNVYELLSKYFFIVIPRGDSNEETIIDSNPILKAYKEKFIIVHNLDKLDISATKIRNSINNKKEVCKYTSPKVIDYIYKNHLYNT